MRRRLVIALLFALLSLDGSAQIVNHLKADRSTYLTYADCRMRPFRAENLQIADSLYALGTAAGDYRITAYALHIRMALDYVKGDMEGMNASFEEIRSLVGERKEARFFWLGVEQEWCIDLIRTGHAAEAMLEARAMERQAVIDKSALGKLYAYKIIGLIQSERTNHTLAAENFLSAANFCRDARAEHELPFLYILLAQEFIELKQFGNAEQYCRLAEHYLSIYNKTLPIKTMRVRTLLCNARGRNAEFWQHYEELSQDPMYAIQLDAEDRHALEVLYLRSKGQLREALAVADSLGNDRMRYDLKQGLYASLGDYPSAYGELERLMVNKDSTYIRVQNEDLAILDKEMDNARLREEAQKLKAQNQATIFIGFLVMFAIAFMAILLSQWQLRENLEEMRRKNSEMLRSRRNFQKAMEAKEAEVNSKLQLLQNRTTNVLTGYEEYLDY